MSKLFIKEAQYTSLEDRKSLIETRHLVDQAAFCEKSMQCKMSLKSICVIGLGNVKSACQPIGSIVCLYLTSSTIWIFGLYKSIKYDWILTCICIYQSMIGEVKATCLMLGSVCQCTIFNSTKWASSHIDMAIKISEWRMGELDQHQLGDFPSYERPNS